MSRKQFSVNKKIIIKLTDKFHNIKNFIPKDILNNKDILSKYQFHKIPKKEVILKDVSEQLDIIKKLKTNITNIKKIEDIVRNNHIKNNHG